MGLPSLTPSACFGKPVKIYALIDSRDGTAFYVGATTRRLCDRLSGHMQCAVRLHQSDVKSQIVRAIVAAAKKVEILELEVAQFTEWAEAEQFWISYLRYVGAALTNKSIGGAGKQGTRTSPETRKLMSEAAAGRDMSKLHTPEVREIAAAKLRGKPGRKPTKETLQRLSESHKGKTWPPGQREKFVAKMTGRKRGPTGKPSVRRRAIVIDGVQYDGLTPAADQLDVCISTISRWLRSGLATYADGRAATPALTPMTGRGRASGARNGKARAVIVRGVMYPTLTEAARSLGHDKSTIMTWLKKGRAQYAP